MKKIVTLFFFMGAVTAAFAQTSEQDKARRVILSGGGADSKTDRDTRNSRDVILGGDRTIYDGGSTNYPYPGTYPTSGSRQGQIDQVNRDYDAKIRSIQNNSRLSSAEKERIIRDLNNDRARVIRQINGRSDTNRRYEDRRDRNYDDDNYKKNKNYKGNNGNHYGWEKGKGNPHKSSNYSNGNNGKGKGKKN